jgi:hypothetical protein
MLCQEYKDLQNVGYFHKINGLWMVHTKPGHSIADTLFPITLYSYREENAL